MKQQTLQIVLLGFFITALALVAFYFAKQPHNVEKNQPNIKAVFIAKHMSTNFYQKYEGSYDEKEENFDKVLPLFQYKGSLIKRIEHSNSCGIQESRFFNKIHLGGTEQKLYNVYTLGGEWCEPYYQSKKALVEVLKDKDGWLLEAYFTVEKDSMGELFIADFTFGEVAGVNLDSLKTYLLEPYYLADENEISPFQLKESLETGDIVKANGRVFLKKSVYIKELQSAISAQQKN
ncbi:hypothetical protein [Kangiella geojedonensis]|uniref:Uncharacterized protein n=1 Tax=Kangiella geojedonensis TaxID=914150 RepID=A0A0F6RCH2_9GAMM|nr:hypothetical protein [Kangiella geojedonensis]AKE52403.1 hypothetical protein TQ33_1455 [Kangiella geojedonensis]